MELLLLTEKMKIFAPTKVIILASTFSYYLNLLQATSEETFPLPD